jgi:hypothetical protein
MKGTPTGNYVGVPFMGTLDFSLVIIFTIYNPSICLRSASSS